MADPIRLKLCPRCGTGIPEAAAVCPECGAPQDAPEAGPGRGVDPLQMLFGSPAERREGFGRTLQPVLAGRLGCLLWAAAVVFGVPLAVGALLGEPLGGLAVPLLVVSTAGLVLTGVLVWLVWPARRRRS